MSIQYDSTNIIENQEKNLDSTDELFMQALAEMDDDPTMVDPDAVSEVDIFKYSEETQSILCAALIHDKELLSIAASLEINPRSFKENTYKTFVRIAFDYFEQYGEAPPKQYFKEQIFQRYETNDKRAYYLGVLNALEYMPEVYPREYWRVALGKFAKASNYHWAFHKFAEGAKQGIDIDDLHAEYCERYEKLNAVSMSDDQLEALDAIEFLERAEEQSNKWIVDNWIAEKCLHLWVGPKKLGKTSTLTSLVPCLMDGNRWLGRIQVKQCPVVVVDFENPQSYIAENLLLYASKDRFEEHKGQLSIPKETPKSMTKEFLKRYIEKHYPDAETGVVIIDAAVAAFGARFGNIPDWDNKATEVRKVLHELLAVARETNWAIVLVHHANKQGDTGGTVHWEAAVDFVLSFDQYKSDRKLEAKWGRWVKDKPDRLVFRKVNGCIELVDVRDDQEESEQGDRDQVLEAVPVLGIDETATEESMVSVEDLVQKTGLKKYRVKEILLELTTGQFINRHRKDITSPYLYYRYHWA